MKLSDNTEVNGIIKNGFDYDLQVWIKDYIIQDLQIARDLKIVGRDIRDIKNKV